MMKARIRACVSTRAFHQHARGQGSADAPNQPSGLGQMARAPGQAGDTRDPLPKPCGTLIPMLWRSSALPFVANSAAIADKWRLLAHPDPGPKALADFCRGSQALHYCADAHRTGPPGLVREPLLLPDRSAVSLQGPGSCRCGCTGSPAGMLCFPEFCHRTGPGKPVPPPVPSGPPCRHGRFSPPTPRAFVDIGCTVCRPCACICQ